MNFNISYSNFSCLKPPVELPIENIFFEVCPGVCVSAKARRLLKIIMENAKLNEENWQLGGVEG